MCKIYFKFVFPAWKQQFLQGLSVKAQWGIQLNTVIFQTLKFYVEFNLTLLLISHDVNHLSSRQSKLQTLLLECIYSLKSLHFLKFSLLWGVRGPALFPNLYPNLKSSDEDNKPSPWSNVSVRTEDERVVIKSSGEIIVREFNYFYKYICSSSQRSMLSQRHSSFLVLIGQGQGLPAMEEITYHTGKCQG